MNKEAKMNADTLRAAKLAARKFLALAQEADQAWKNDKYFFISGTKLSGSLRRASMELTRALTEMRKPH
jgi:hypothetical protein